MKSLRRYWPLLAAALVVALGATLALTGMLPKTDKAAGTQSDSHVGTSQYPAPKKANPKPPSFTVDNPDAITALPDVNAKCPWADADSNRPSLQDDGIGTQTFADMPQKPSANTVKCTVARAKAAGYMVDGNSVKCTEELIEINDGGKNWQFRPFCMNISPAANPTCMVNLVPTDIQGNFFWADEPSFRHQDASAEYVRNLSSFAGC